MRTALVCGGGGFIGHHMVRRLVAEGYWVRAVDRRLPRFSPSEAQDCIIADLRDPAVCRAVVDRRFDEVYQFAADMGGAGFVFTGEHDADIMRNSGTINGNMLDACARGDVGRIFFPSSACVYPAANQRDPAAPNCAEDSVYPAAPDSDYGWEKLFSERLYLAFARNKGLAVRIARFHNIFGPEGDWTGGREKAPAAICRKVAMAPDGGVIDIWGDGRQTRSFLAIDECLEGTLRLVRSAWTGPVNIGSEEMISIDGLADMVMAIAGKTLTKRHVSGPLGVRGRTSDNRLIRQRLGWAPSRSLRVGLETTYAWIAEAVRDAAIIEKASP